MNTNISEKEFAVIAALSGDESANQRNIAKKLGISLGLTNLIIKRLVKMGYLKIVQLNRNKIQYILTPAGFSEKAKKSYSYTLRTVRLLKAIREAIRVEIISQYSKGKKVLIIAGDNELADLTEGVFRNLGADLAGMKYVRDKQGVSGDGFTSDCVTIFCCGTAERVPAGGIDLIAYLAEKGLYL
jgi:DNA-binding MarR family transcriptional regulator